MNLTDIKWQNGFSKDGHSNICHPPPSFRTLPHAGQEVESMSALADPGQGFVTAATNGVWLRSGYVTSEAMPKNASHFDIVLSGWLLSWNSAIIP